MLREQLLQEALNLLVYGLSTVFIFLCLLIFLTIIMSKIVLSMEVREVFKEKGLNIKRAAKAAAVEFHKKKN